ncbi:hypothetical protein GGR53DRAFT_527278 [Hypoxylon sp. FL1150]|nr:hypothetical protein GGR53DRAFT_527278 [Hypoxylon sp. FL1150]
MPYSILQYIAQMVYTMKFRVSGLYRNNGGNGVVGAAVICLTRLRELSDYSIARPLESDDYVATKPRADLFAMTLAQQLVVEINQVLRDHPLLSIIIFSDSMYAIEYMEDRPWDSRHHRWSKSRRSPILDKDIEEIVARLDDFLKKIAYINYVLVTREENKVVEDKCKSMLDAMQRERKDKEEYSGGGDDDSQISSSTDLTDIYSLS